MPFLCDETEWRKSSIHKVFWYSLFQIRKPTPDEQITFASLGEKDHKDWKENKITFINLRPRNNFHTEKEFRGKNHIPKELKWIYSENKYQETFGNRRRVWKQYFETLHRRVYFKYDENIPVYVFYKVDRYNEKPRKLEKTLYRATGESWMRGEILRWRGADQFHVIFEWFQGRQEPVKTMICSGNARCRRSDYMQ